MAEEEPWVLLFDASGTIDEMPASEVATLWRGLNADGGYDITLVSIDVRRAADIMSNIDMDRAEKPSMWNLDRTKPEKMRDFIRLFTEPHRCILVDDNKQNIETAKSIGVQAILFKRYPPSFTWNDKEFIGGPEVLGDLIRSIRRDVDAGAAPTAAPKLTLG